LHDSKDNQVVQHKRSSNVNLRQFMEHIANAPHLPATTGTDAKPPRKAADYVYQAATVAAALLLLLTATV
jgi:hypothetical protein